MRAPNLLAPSLFVLLGQFGLAQPCSPSGVTDTASSTFFDTETNYESFCSNSTIPPNRRFFVVGWTIDYELNPAAATVGVRYTLRVTDQGGNVILSESEDFGPGIFPPAQPGQTVFRKTRERAILVPEAAFATGLQLTIFAGITGPLIPKGSGSATIGVVPDVRFTLAESRTDFIPRAAQDSAANCSQALWNCYPEYEARLLFSGQPVPPTSPNYPRGRMRFIIEENQALPAAQRGPLRGISSNFGQETAPDYIFEDSRQDAGIFDPATSQGTRPMILTRQANRTQAKVVVSSRDYGGTAKLRAQIRFDPNDNVWIDAQVERPNGMPASPTPDRASLPIDDDNDGLADEWERQNGGLQLTPDADAEQGHAAAQEKFGDGYVTHDEYRGFHHLDANGAVAHVRTDPTQFKDVFFWDATGRQPSIQTAIGLILAPATDRHRYRRIDRRFTAALPNTKPASPWSGPVARNSIQPANARKCFPLIFLNRTLGQGAGLRQMGNSQKQEMIGWPILLDHDAINTKAQQIAFPPDVLFAQTVAHETGHQFGLGHHIRNVPTHILNAQGNTGLLALTLAQYASPALPSRQFSLRLQHYQIQGAPTPRGEQGESVAVFIPALAETSPPAFDGEIAGSLTFQLPDAANLLHVYRARLTSPADLATGRFLVATQQLDLMDWSPNLNRRLATDWRFSAPDLQSMKVKAP